MISSPSRLADWHRTLVLDASAAINLLGTGQAERLLEILDRQVSIEETACSEVHRDPSTGQPGAESIARLTSAGLLARVRLTQLAVGVFIGLTGAESPDDLDDGEAATIAYAESVGAAAVIDERKATRVALSRPNNLVVLTTLDLLSANVVTATLGPTETSEAIFAALQNARMRVPRIFLQWVREQIGADRAALCPSIRRSERERTQMT